MELHEDIKGLVEKEGKEILQSATLANILSDISVDFNKNPATKSILKAMLNDGFVVSLMNLEQEEVETRQLKAQSLAKEYSRKNGFKDEIVDKLTNCLLYSLGWIENINKETEAKRVEQSPLKPNSIEQKGTFSQDVLVTYDPLIVDAARLVVKHQTGATSMIQRAFSIGYNRAGRIMDQLEKKGIVGPALGAKPREVLIKDPRALESLLECVIDGYHRNNEIAIPKPTGGLSSFSDSLKNERFTNTNHVEKKHDDTKGKEHDFRTKLLRFLKWLLSIPLIIFAHIINFVQEKGCIKTGCLVVVAVPIIMGTISNLLDSNNNDNNKEDKVEEVPIALVQVIDSLFEKDRNNNWENSVVAEKFSKLFTERFVNVINNDTTIMLGIPLYLSEWEKLSKGQYLLHFYGGGFWSKIDWRGLDVDFHIYCVVTEDIVMTLNQGKHYIVNGEYLKQIPKNQRSKIKDKIYFQENVVISSDRYERKFKFDLHDFFVINPNVIAIKEE